MMRSSELSFRQELSEILKGGFAPSVILLREFHYDKSGVVLDGLPYSAYGLLEHMRHRQRVFLDFFRHPQNPPELWPQAYWPQNQQPENEAQWKESIAAFEAELEEMRRRVEDPETDLYMPRHEGKSLAWAALANAHHNGYHIGQIKAIGRQLGVW
jgi:uncharacterized damage-inducible protein DinB